MDKILGVLAPVIIMAVYLFLNAFLPGKVGARLYNKTGIT